MLCFLCCFFYFYVSACVVVVVVCKGACIFCCLVPLSSIVFGIYLLFRNINVCGVISGVVIYVVAWYIYICYNKCPYVYVFIISTVYDNIEWFMFVCVCVWWLFIRETYIYSLLHLWCIFIFMLHSMFLVSLCIRLQKLCARLSHTVFFLCVLFSIYLAPRLYLYLRLPPLWMINDRSTQSACGRHLLCSYNGHQIDRCARIIILAMARAWGHCVLYIHSFMYKVRNP